jgi:hypothetical protein
MASSSNDSVAERPRWRYVALAALVFVLAGTLLAVVWQLPRLLPGLFPLSSEPVPSATPAASLVVPTPTPAVLEPTISHLAAEVDDRARTITFRLEAQVPPEREIAQVLLWYDTEAGHAGWRTTGPFSSTTTVTYRLDAVREGLTRTLTTTHELDYWWLMQDTSGGAVRAGGTAILGPNLWSSVATPTPEPPPVDFTWAFSDTQHFAFYFVPGSAAERDRSQIGGLAESALQELESTLNVELDDRMSVYLVPRIFWQGGAAYGDKVQLISYLDRNYTAIETWSYFTHEGTHALAQDLLEPKEEDGGPDGVLVEGLAVWASNGHYRREPIDAWAAVTAASDEFIPLAELRAGPFYDFQHETSYMEAASFVKFLVERYGLDRLKELYGNAIGEAEHDEALVRRLYGKGYDLLEDEWLDYLATLNPTCQQAEIWRLKVRSFDLMRRYETELDPDARLLPSDAPPEWTSDTLKVFLGRRNAPVNVVLETTLIAAREWMYRGDLEGAATLMDDVENALDANGALVRPSLKTRQAILDMLAAQDRAILRADADAYRATLDPASALVSDTAVQDRLQPPFSAYRQEVVRLDLSGDGLGAKGLVLVHGGLVDGDFPDDGRLFAATFVKRGDRWLASGWQAMAVVLSLPPAQTD